MCACKLTDPVCPFSVETQSSSLWLKTKTSMLNRTHKKTVLIDYYNTKIHFHEEIKGFTENRPSTAWLAAAISLYSCHVKEPF